MEALLHSSTELSYFIPRLLTRALGITAVWTIGHEEGTRKPHGHAHELLAFADRPTLQALRKCADLHRGDVAMLVVVDGDLFEQAWGERVVSGSLARWAWRQVSPQVAYYDESRWAGRGGDGSVLRVRRKALLLWETARR